MTKRYDLLTEAATVADDPATENTWRGIIARALINKHIAQIPKIRTAKAYRKRMGTRS